MLRTSTILLAALAVTLCSACDGAAEDETDLDTDVLSDTDLDTEPDPLVAAVDGGELVGVRAEHGTLAFLGVPFAAPPVHELRFRPPEPHPGWSGRRPADRFGPKCMQIDGEQGTVVGEEDCLTLNIWRPEEPGVAEPGLPVLVFVHGGGNVFGSAAEETSPGSKIYDGSSLAGRDGVVVVTIQYRLNALGYLADASLDGAEPSGNYGLRDQVMALDWVQQNIHSFGGDPDRVMLFGESGGAASVCGILATPAAEGLFHAASIMSGGCGGKPRSQLLDLGARVANEVGCGEAEDRAACLREVDATALVEASNAPSTAGGFAIPWAGPTVDGAYLPESPSLAIRAGRHHRVPLLIGTTADETSSPLFGIAFGLTEDQYRSTVRAAFQDRAEAVLQRYPVDAFPTPRAALVALTTDLQFTCPTRIVAREAEAWSPVYHYVYDHAYDGTNEGSFHPWLFGAAHGFELPLLFETLPTYEGYEPSAAETQLSREMASRWASFATTGVPASDWPAYGGRRTQVLSTDGQIVTDYRDAYCEFWERQQR